MARSGGRSALERRIARRPRLLFTFFVRNDARDVVWSVRISRRDIAGRWSCEQFILTLMAQAPSWIGFVGHGDPP